ncbi:hypothetical protein C3747_35g133 [Trypanosoma cruzi]|uniref:Uncharacterized protein n=1 Tax=Trypanosoma cruzi TaxID=5693 RepID=A0A2V2X1D2_TRYCR|nr:hypothetical protein C3747_35g133 [Trypanosoma cruzi]RNC45757.1 hypothetical protein TcCL_NonESM04475 [Trypanosoma cruzi]
MPEVGLDRAFLHRCCVQVSSALADDAAVAAEIQHTLRFVRDHACKYPGEITRALIWRVVDTDNNEVQDRLGAWSVLNAVLAECADIKQPLSSTAIAEKISLFLPYLITYRWYSIHSVSSMNRARSLSAVALLSEYDKVVPASVLTGDDSRLGDAQKEGEIRAKYREFLTTWKAVWRHDVYQRFKEAVRRTEGSGNSLSSKERPYLDIPATFRDSLRRLRRRNPRPSIAFHVLSCYGWVPPTEAETAPTEPMRGLNGTNEGQISSNNDYAKRCPVVPKSITEIEKLDPAAHPRVRQWLRKLVEEGGGCRLCDVWNHTETRCPCELPFIKVPPPEGSLHLQYRRRRTERTNMSYLEAVEKLFRYGIRLPLSVEKTLDRIVSLIKDEASYEELLEAFDTVRGAITGPLERHALWLHASYMLMPSRTVFDKPSDDALSPAMEKAEKHFKVHRRFREWDQLLQSVEVLDSQYRRAELSPALRRNIEEVRETKSFFFCLIDGSQSAEYVPQSYARVPEEVLQLRPVKDVLCTVCLEPFHVAARCSKGTEPWDLSVARVLLEEHNLLNMKFPEERHMFDKVLRTIDEDDRKAKEFRKKELCLAVKLVHEGRVPYCRLCNIMGHSIRRCEEAARRTLHRHKIKDVDMRLNPHLVQRKIKQLRDANDEREERWLTEAWELLGKGRTYPDSFLSAIRELEDARIPLAAARYSTDAVQGFLLFIKSNDLLQHLQPLRDERFPEVCLFCDSYHHGSELCDRANAEERGFLSELRRYGLTLWQYLRAPERYDERFPTDYPKGRETVLGLARQFEEDYSPGGIARVRFVENNGLDGDVTSPVAAGGMLSFGSSQRSFYGGSSYGIPFSQLVLRPGENYGNNNNNDSNKNTIEAAAVAMSVHDSSSSTNGITMRSSFGWPIGGETPTEMVMEPAATVEPFLDMAGGHGGKRGREADDDSVTKSGSGDDDDNEEDDDDINAKPHANSGEEEIPLSMMLQSSCGEADGLGHVGRRFRLETRRKEEE